MDKETNIAMQFQSNFDGHSDDGSFKPYRRTRYPSKRRDIQYTSDGSESEVEGDIRDFAPPEQSGLEKHYLGHHLAPSVQKSSDLAAGYFFLNIYDKWITQGRLKGVFLGYDVIQFSIEKQICIAHDLVSKLGWLEEPESFWKYRLRRRASKASGLLPLDRYGLMDVYAKCFLLLAFIGLIYIYFNLKHFKSFTSIFLSFGFLFLTLRALIIIIWTRKINWWIRMFNQFIGVYADMDQNIKKGINWLQEIELVSKGFRNFNQSDKLSLSDSTRREVLYKVYDILHQALYKFDTAQSSLIEEFSSYLDVSQPSFLGQIDDNDVTEETITLSLVKLQLEQCFQSRTVFLSHLFSVMSEHHLQSTSMGHVLHSLQFTGHQLSSLSYSGNAHAIQIISFLEPKSSHSSRKPSQSGIDFSSEKGESSLEIPSQEDIKLTRVLRSLSTLEFEMRTWHAQLHIFNQALTARDESSPKVIFSQFQSLVKSIDTIASDANLALQNIKVWSENDNSLSPTNVQLLNSEENFVSTSPEELLDSFVLCDAKDQDPISLLKQKEEVFEGDVVVSPVQEFKPLTLEERKTRQENFKIDQQKKRERQDFFLGMVQELGDAVRSHANSRQILKQLPKENPVEL